MESVAPKLLSSRIGIPKAKVCMSLPLIVAVYIILLCPCNPPPRCHVTQVYLCLILAAALVLMDNGMTFRNVVS